MPPTLQSIVCRNPDIVTNKIDGETVMMSLSEGSFFGLNAVGSFIWNWLEEPAPLEVIIAGIVEQFEVSQEQCQKDVLVFVKDLVDSQVLLVVE
jgi:hypothetical protein